MSKIRKTIYSFLGLSASATTALFSLTSCNSNNQYSIKPNINTSITLNGTTSEILGTLNELQNYSYETYTLNVPKAINKLLFNNIEIRQKFIVDTLSYDQLNNLNIYIENNYKDYGWPRSYVSNTYNSWSPSAFKVLYDGYKINISSMYDLHNKLANQDFLKSIMKKMGRDTINNSYAIVSDSLPYINVNNPSCIEINIKEIDKSDSQKTTSINLMIPTSSLNVLTDDLIVNITSKDKSILIDSTNNSKKVEINYQIGVDSKVNFSNYSYEYLKEGTTNIDQTTLFNQWGFYKGLNNEFDYNNICKWLGIFNIDILNISCDIDKTKDIPIGKVSFTISLKDGYFWTDGSLSKEKTITYENFRIYIRDARVSTFFEYTESFDMSSYDKGTYSWNLHFSKKENQEKVFEDIKSFIERKQQNNFKNVTYEYLMSEVVPIVPPYITYYTIILKATAFKGHAFFDSSEHNVKTEKKVTVSFRDIIWKTN